METMRTAVKADQTPKKGTSSARVMFLQKRLSREVNVVPVLVQRLNEEGKLTKRDKPYNEVVVRNALNGRTEDLNVEAEYTRLVAEQEGLTKEIKQLLDQAIELIGKGRAKKFC